MFSILLAHFGDSTENPVRKVLQQKPQIQLFEAYTKAQLKDHLQKQEIHCFLFIAPTDVLQCQTLMQSIRSHPAHAFTPIFMLSPHIEQLIAMFLHHPCCEFFITPLTAEKETLLNGLLHFYESSYHKMHASYEEFFHLQTGKHFYKIPYCDVLFIESTPRGSLVHLKEEVLIVPTPISHFGMMAGDTRLVRTHRSYVVNIDNVCSVDKSTDPWRISFFHSSKEAFVSRNHKKYLIPYL